MRRSPDLRDFVHSPREGLAGRFAAHVRALSSGDKAIAFVLMGALALAVFAGLYQLERQFLVEIPSHGGGLVEGVVGAPRFVNPLLALSDADRDLVSLVYAGLMGYDGEGRLVPVLAESYEISEDGKTYTFLLREDAEFSDGSPVTSEDVVFTIEEAQDPRLKSPELARWSGIRVEALDARQVAFTLSEAHASFLADATLGILPAHLWRDVSDEEFPFSPLMEKPVGAGPFAVASVSRGKDGVVEEYRLRAAGAYPLGKPYLDRLTFVYFDNEEELAEALSRGRVESAYGIPSEGALRAPYSRVFGVFFNQGQNALFARSEVREALSLALNREALVEDVLGGYGTPLWGPVPPSSFASARTESTGATPADPVAAARELLTDAGWEYDEDEGAFVLAKPALTLTVTMRTANVPELKALAERVKRDWEAAGIPVAVELYEPGELATDVIRPRAYDALLFGMVIGRQSDLFAFWDASQRADPGLNVALYANRAADTLLEDIRAEQDPGALAEALAKLDALIAADYPAVFIEAPDFIYAVPEGLRGVSLARVAAPSDRLMGAAGWYRETAWVWPAFAGR